MSYTRIIESILYSSIERRLGTDIDLYDVSYILDDAAMMDVVSAEQISEDDWDDLIRPYATDGDDTGRCSLREYV